MESRTKGDDVERGWHVLCTPIVFFPVTHKRNVLFACSCSIFVNKTGMLFFPRNKTVSYVDKKEGCSKEERGNSHSLGSELKECAHPQL